MGLIVLHVGQCVVTTSRADIGRVQRTLHADESGPVWWRFGPPHTATASPEDVSWPRPACRGRRQRQTERLQTSIFHCRVRGMNWILLLLLLRLPLKVMNV